MSPCRSTYPREGPGENFKKYPRKSYSAENESITQLPTLIHCRTQSVCAQSQRIVRNQSESSTKNPHPSSAHQNRARKKPFNFVSQSESSFRSPESSANQNRVLRHPRALGSGGGPVLVLGSSRLAIAYLNT